MKPRPAPQPPQPRRCSEGRVVGLIKPTRIEPRIRPPPPVEKPKQKSPTPPPQPEVKPKKAPSPEKEKPPELRKPSIILVSRVLYKDDLLICLLNSDSLLINY